MDTLAPCGALDRDCPLVVVLVSACAAGFLQSRFQTALSGDLSNSAIRPTSGPNRRSEPGLPRDAPQRRAPRVACCDCRCNLSTDQLQTLHVSHCAHINTTRIRDRHCKHRWRLQKDAPSGSLRSASRCNTSGATKDTFFGADTAAVSIP